MNCRSHAPDLFPGPPPQTSLVSLGGEAPVSDGMLCGWSGASVPPPLLSSGRAAGTARLRGPLSSAPPRGRGLRGRCVSGSCPWTSAPQEAWPWPVWMLEGDTFGYCEQMLRSLGQVQLKLSEEVTAAGRWPPSSGRDVTVHRAVKFYEMKSFKKISTDLAGVGSCVVDHT